MSEIEEHTPKREHGTTKSYVTGFILSLVFTIIPYYLVVEKVMTGNAVIGTILGFGVLQMLVQVIFFLHLGREKKPYWQRSFLMATIGGIVVVVGGSLWIMSHLRYNMTPVTRDDESMKLIEDEGIPQIGGEKTGACSGQYETYKVTLKDSTIVPNSISAKMCDRLTFINDSSETRYIMFGSFETPEAYGGEDMLTITKMRPKTIVLNQTGTHQFHDHQDAEQAGQFTVTE